MEPIPDRLENGAVKTIVATCFLLGFCSLMGCSRAITSVEYDASGYSNRALKGRELLYVARKYAVASQYQFIGIRRRIENAPIDEAKKNEMYQQIEFLQSRVGDNLELASSYYDPRVTTEAQQRQIFRAVTDRLDQITKEYLELSQTLSTAEKRSKSE